MSSRFQFAIDSIRGWFDQFRNKELELSGLQANLVALHGALEGDVPKELRDAIEEGAERLELIRFTLEANELSAAAEGVVVDLETIIGRWDSMR